MGTIRSGQGLRQLIGILAGIAIAFGVITVPQAAPAELCFNQPGVTACVAPEFRSYWESNGGLAVFGYPLEAARQEQTPEGTFLVQYFERQRFELHPEKAAPYNVLLGRANDEVLAREGRNWRDFPKVNAGASGCAFFAETQHSVCGDFLRYWRSQGLNFGDRGVSYRESLALWGLPLSQPQEELNIDGDTVMTQHFERARMEVHVKDGRRSVLLTRLGAALVPLRMKIFAVNDFHGQLSTGRTVAGKPVGGAAYLAAYIKQRRAQTPYSLTVHAGDMVGASPPVSALLQDQPTMEFMNMLGFDVGTSGNHEFDEGIGEYKRLVEGGCHPTAGCWSGAKFSYLTSNVVDTKTGKTIFPAHKIVNVAGARIGFIGAVLKQTPEIVIPTGIAGLEFRDEADSINASVAELKKVGVRAIVVLIHQGGNQAGNVPTGALTGAIVDIANRVDDEVDIIASGHTHQFTNAVVDGKLITQAFSYSQAFADIDVTIDRARRDIVEKKAEIVTTFNEGVTPDAEVGALVKKYEDQVAPLVNRVIGTAAARITNEQNAAGESALGNLIADAQRKAMGTQFAFMNPGGIRAPIEAGEVTWGELYAVQPFANDLVKMRLTGDQIYTLLNQQWQPQSDGSVRTRFLQISGLSYTWSDARAVGDKVVEVRGPGGTPIDRAASYTVTVNSFLAVGGDAFTILTRGTERVTGPVDLDALVDYVKVLPQPFNAAIEGRIVKQ
ncbi:MAG TPA: bifunctional metallophosphatase/5'-nucleotidase [Herpetosiphonaceae bacterium]